MLKLSKVDESVRRYGDYHNTQYSSNIYINFLSTYLARNINQIVFLISMNKLRIYQLHNITHIRR